MLVWGCTVPVEIAHRIQNGISDRLSIQFFNSIIVEIMDLVLAAVVGKVVFADFYSAQGKVIPWSNTNANFRDAAQYCSDSSSIPASVISTVPYYPITPSSGILFLPEALTKIELSTSSRLSST